MRGDSIKQNIVTLPKGFVRVVGSITTSESGLVTSRSLRESELDPQRCSVTVLFCASAGIGRQRRFKPDGRKVCEFESHEAHHQHCPCTLIGSAASLKMKWLWVRIPPRVPNTKRSYSMKEQSRISSTVFRTVAQR